MTPAASAAFAVPIRVGQCPDSAPATIRQPSWLAIVLPALALEVCGLSNRQVCAVTRETPRGQQLLAVAAAGAGLHPGMDLTAALALYPQLVHRPQDPTAEARRLADLSRWGHGFTPQVSTTADALLLEVGASLRLFGGHTALIQQLRQSLERRWDHDYRLAVAPTPQASLLLARAGQQQVITQEQDLRAALGRLAVTELALSKDLTQSLQRLGLRSLHDLWRLPRDGLARRFGPQLPGYLDRLLGVDPDPRLPVAVPPTFSAALDLPLPATASGPVLAASSTLLEQLRGFLRRIDGAVTALALELQHRRQPATVLMIHTREADRDPDRLVRLCRERLQQTRLPEAVERVQLSCREIFPYRPVAGSLFQSKRHPGQTWAECLEQIEARLGCGCCYFPATQADHRPERAWRDGSIAPGVAVGQRPLWLLPQPQPLDSRGGRLWHHGEVLIEDGPERIESGWWDGADCCRDYYLARQGGGRLWIFQDLKQPGWYLHGLFG